MKIPFKVDLTGKTAIVTGGSGTLCSAMAYGLAVSGAKTAIIGRNQEKLLKVVNKLTEDALNEYGKDVIVKGYSLSLIHISEPTRRTPISYAVFCLKKKKKKT